MSTLLRTKDAKTAVVEVVGAYLDFVLDVMGFDGVIAQINGEVVVGSADSIRRAALAASQSGTRSVLLENIIGELFAQWQPNRIDQAIGLHVLDQTSERLKLTCVAKGQKGISISRLIRV